MFFLLELENQGNIIRSERRSVFISRHGVVFKNNWRLSQQYFDLGGS